jgi:hypothetical protein
MRLTLAVAAGLLAAQGPEGEPRKGWVVEVRGYTYHPQASRRIIELQGLTRPPKQVGPPLKVWHFEWQFPQAKPQVDVLEVHYHADLSAFFKQLKPGMR